MPGNGCGSKCRYDAVGIILDGTFTKSVLDSFSSESLAGVIRYCCSNHSGFGSAVAFWGPEEELISHTLVTSVQNPKDYFRPYQNREDRIVDEIIRCDGSPLRNLELDKMPNNKGKIILALWDILNQTRDRMKTYPGRIAVVIPYHRCCLFKPEELLLNIGRLEDYLSKEGLL